METKTNLELSKTIKVLCISAILMLILCRAYAGLMLVPCEPHPVPGDCLPVSARTWEKNKVLARFNQ